MRCTTRAALLNERFLLCNGDTILDFNLARLLADAAAEPGPRIVLRDVPETDRYGVVTLEGGRVSAFQHARRAPGPGLVNAGIYLMDRSILPLLSPVCSLEADVLAGPGRRRCAGRDGGVRLLHRYRHPRGSGPRANGAAPRSLTARPCSWTATAPSTTTTAGSARGSGGSGSPARKEAIRAATEAGWHVFVVTNQSGIARGYYDEAALDAAAWLDGGRIRRAGGTVDDIRFCPFHEEAGVGRYRQASDWRKPAPGMILDLIAKWGLRPGALRAGGRSAERHGGGRRCRYPRSAF